MLKTLRLATVFMALIVLAKPAAAYPIGPIVGTLVLSGSSIRVYAPGPGSPSGSGAGYIDWFPLGPPDGTITVQPTSTGYFSTFTGFTDHILDLDQGLYPAGFGGFPGGPLDNFETVTGTGLDFKLVTILPCSASLIGTCDAGPTSPFVFLFDGSSTTLHLVMRGSVTDTLNPGYTSGWLGTFSADYPGRSPADILNDFVTFGYSETGYSAAKITSDVPEPATLLTFGIGSLVLARRRRRNKA